MHELVILDETDRVIRFAILWNDDKTQKQTDYLNEIVGRERLPRYTVNIVFARFMASKIF